MPASGMSCRSLGASRFKSIGSAMADEGEVEARIVAWDVRTLGRKVECQSSFHKVTTSLRGALSLNLKEEWIWGGER